MTQGYNNNSRRIMRFYVDGLLPECEDQDVRHHFSQFGRVLEAFVAREKDTYLSRCFATVAMQDQSVSARLLRQKDHEIWGSPVVVKSEAPTEKERPDTHVPPPPPIGEALNEAGRFFAMGLTQDISKDDLVDYFGKFGEVSDCIVANDEGGNRVAAIRMTDPFAVGSVLEEEAHEVKGYRLKIDEKLEKPMTPQPVHAQHGVSRPPPPPPSAASGAGPGGDLGEVEPGKFFIGGCARGTTEEELWAYFGALGKVSQLNVVKDKNTGMSKGCCFVTFAEPSEDIRKAMVDQTHTIKEAVVRVDEARKKAPGAKGKGKGYDSYGGGGGGSWDSYGGKGGGGGSNWNDSGRQQQWGHNSDWGNNNSNDWRGDSNWGGKSQGGKGGGQDWGQSRWGSNDQNRGGGGWGGQGGWGDSGGKGSKRSDDRGGYDNQNDEPPRKRHQDDWRGGGGSSW